MYSDETASHDAHIQRTAATTNRVLLIAGSPLLLSGKPLRSQAPERRRSLQLTRRSARGPHSKPATQLKHRRSDEGSFAEIDFGDKK